MSDYLERPKAILEQLFDGNQARVLDHLTTMRPFEFSSKELHEILDIPMTELIDILIHLEEYKLIESFVKDEREYRLLDNKKTQHLNRFLYEVMVDFLEQHSKKGDSKV